MRDLRTIDIPKITDGEKFEYLCRDLWRNNSDYEFIELNGRKGQKQFGVDVFGRNVKSEEWLGIQCKVKAIGQALTKSDIETEINKAKLFNPSLSVFKLCTTLDRDAKVQKIVRGIQTELSKSKEFKLEILFWDDIEEQLKEEDNFNIYYKYYQKFFADNTTFGHSIGKLFNLELGCDNKLDTHYEVMLGKIPNYKESKHTNVNYYRGTYFIVNFHQNKIETFTWPCFESDISEAFPNDYDRFRVTQWMSDIKDIDDFIYSDESKFIYFITAADREQHYDDMKDLDP